MADTLKNLQYMTINKGMKHIIGGDKMSHFPDMRIQDDSTLYAKLLEKKRSAFDRSKFEVVGSPTITDDGIASGFGSGNYPKADVSITPVNRLVFKSRIIYNTSGNTSPYPQAKVFYGTNNNWKLQTNYGDNIQFSSTDLGNIYLNIGTMADGDIIDTELIITTTSVTINAIHNGVNFTKTESKNVTFGLISDLVFGNMFNGGKFFFTGSIDLKQFSITVDGKEVFNGNKEGLDVIKPDEFTVVGSPTITADGIASGFSDSAYLKHSIIKTGNSVKIKIRIKTSTLDGNTHYVLRGLDEDLPSGAGAMGLVISNTNKLWLIGYTSSGGYTNVGNYIINADTEYLIEAEYASNKITYKVNNTDVATISGSYKLPKSFALGNSFSSDAPFTGSIDLNAFKIYVDGQLVYQPTLRIPYTQSKTDEKIVDAIYRDRVQDMYEQFGYTHYYTIGDEPEKYNVGIEGQPVVIGGIVSDFGENNTNKAINTKLNYNKLTNKVSSTIRSRYIMKKSNSSQVFLRWLTKASADMRLAINLNNSNIEFRTVDNTSHILGTITKPIVDGDVMDIAVTISGSTMQLIIIKNGEQVFNNTSNYVQDFDNAYLQIGYFATTYGFQGAVDLSQFLIEVDGKEVFRGYEPAITDAFTLATHKGTDVIESYSDGEGTYYEVRADLVQRCVGIIPINTTEVNYPRGFRDAKNIVQVAYSNVGESTAGATIDHIAPKAQTKDGFTIGATTAIQRNYYAEGKAVLG